MGRGRRHRVGVEVSAGRAEVDGRCTALEDVWCGGHRTCGVDVGHAAWRWHEARRMAHGGGRHAAAINMDSNW